MIGRAAYVAAVLLGLGISRLLPEHGLGLFLRLGMATLVVLLPGRLIARALGQRSASATLAWALAALAAALAVVFLVHSSFALALWLLAAIGLAALVFPRREPDSERAPGRGLVSLAGIVLGLLLWHIAPRALTGDSPFHLARVRKLVELDSLSPWRLDELVGGSLHPGYAFPLWHAFLAAVTKLAGVDPALVVQHESALLLPLAVVVAFEAGVALFGSAALGAAAAAAQVALVGFAAGHGGTYPLLARPAPAARQLLVPAVLTLVFAYARGPAWRTVLSIAVASLALALVHPTYAVFLCIPLAGWLVAGALARRRDALRIAAGLAAVALPTGAVSLALLPLARDTVSHAGFLPVAFAFVGGVAVLSRLLGVFVLPLALLAGVVFQVLWPGDFGFRLENGGPEHVAWFAAVAGLLALVIVLVVRRPLELDREDWLASLAAGLFVLPVAVHGFTHWTTNTEADPNALTPGLVRALREDVPKRGVVFSDLQTSYRIAAAAPVLIVAAPPAHVADTKQNRPYERRADVLEFRATGDLAIPRRYHAGWLVVARLQRHPVVELRPLYKDSRFVLYKL